MSESGAAGRVLAIDVGTSIVKAAVVEPDGTVGDAVARPAELHAGRDGVVEQRIEELTGAVLEVARRVIDTADRPIDGIAITGQGDGLWLRDAQGSPVRPAISWMDSRAAAVLDEWDDGVADELYRGTGSCLFPGSPPALLAWLDRHEPESLDRSAVAGRCVDAIAEQLTGAVVVDAASVSAPFLDVRTRDYLDWVPEVCGFGHRRALLPEVAPPGANAPLLPRVASELGLAADTPVYAGPYDVVACQYGAGAHRTDAAVVVLGTTLSCQKLVDWPVAPVDGEPAGSYLCTPTPDRALRIMPSMVGTPAIDWLHRLIGTRSDELDGLLRDSVAGAHGVTALPFYSSAGERAPFVDSSVRARFDGLELTSDRHDLMRALCEAIAFAARSCLARLGEVDAVTGVGGGFRSRQLAQLFADVLQLPIMLPGVEQVGVRGAAVIAQGLTDDPVPDGVVIEPDRRMAAQYEDAYARYLVTVDQARR
ncbi:FGGY family carbohydrate kinase [Agromyces sp. G08B096]|uniref:FGGY family carbohydrate kinase n=1 Tax=Agromyces sp. G08B096 TaxID=3156399 RepID=A0AAU7W4J1_9MICO